jgi:hypothetical protein
MPIKKYLLSDTINNAIVMKNYEQVKLDVQEIVHSEIQRLLNDPTLVHLIFNKKS